MSQEEKEIIDGTIKLPKVTRLEVINKTGRAYVVKDSEVELSYQDEARTLKIFVKPRIEATTAKNKEQK